MAGDKAYSSRGIRVCLRGRGIACIVPERSAQIGGRGDAVETPCRLDRTAYRRRDVIERCFTMLKQHKTRATRDDERAHH